MTKENIIIDTGPTTSQLLRTVPLHDEDRRRATVLPIVVDIGRPAVLPIA